MTSPAPGSATEGREQDCRPDSYGEWPPLFARSSLLAAGGRHWEQTRELGLPRQQWLLTAEALQNAEPGQRTRFRQCARDVRRNSRGHVSRCCTLQQFRPPQLHALPRRNITVATNPEPASEPAPPLPS